MANPNLCTQNRYIDFENNLCWILVILSYLVYALLKIAHFTELKRWGKNQNGRLRLDERLMCFVTYLLWPSMRTHLLQQMTPRNLGYIHSTKNSYRDTLPCAPWNKNYPNNFTCWQRILLVATFKFVLLTIWWQVWKSLDSLLSGAAKNTYFDFLKVTEQLWWNQKKINININYQNTRLPKSDLTTQIWF